MPFPRMRALAAALFVVGAQPALAASGPVVGQPAPDFHALMADGKRLSLADFKGQVLILNFWATWCGPCKVELPLLDTYYKVQKGAGLRVLAVATEGSLQLSDMQPLAKALTIPMVWRIGGPYRDMNAVPTNFVIDRRGVVRYAKAAAFTLDELNAVVVPLLNESAESPLASAPPAETGG